MPTEQELLGIINGQRKYYKEGILRLATLLQEAGLADYARAAIHIADNYGIIDSTEAKTKLKSIDIEGSEHIEKRILHELRDGHLMTRILRARVGNPKEVEWRVAIDHLLEMGLLTKSGNKQATIYKLAS